MAKNGHKLANLSQCTLTALLKGLSYQKLLFSELNITFFNSNMTENRALTMN